MLLASYKFIVDDFLRKMSKVIVFALSDRQNSSLSSLLKLYIKKKLSIKISINIKAIHRTARWNVAE